MPTASVHTESFEEAVRAVAAAKGIPQQRFVFVPMPVMGKSPAELRAYVDGNDPATGQPVMQEVVDDEALRTALREGQIAGAGLDVIEDPPESTDGSEVVARYGDLLSSGKLVLTHHAAHFSEESFRRVHRAVAEEVVRVLRGGEPKALLNPEVRERARGARR